MRVDLVKKISSSFLSCEKDTETILRKLFVESRPYSDILKKLLIINTKDCLTSNNPNYQNKINSLNMKKLIDIGYIQLTPRIEFDEHEEVMSYLMFTFDNFTPNANNPEFRDCTIYIDVICHSKYWMLDNLQIRPLKIIGYIDGILNNARLSGIGELHFAGCEILNQDENLSGYTLAYRAIHSVEGDDKIKPLPPS